MDIAIITLYKNDFDSAKMGSDSPAATIRKSAYIQQKTDETFYQKTNSPVDINFVGGIKVELIDCCEKVLKDISDNFYYDGYIKDGIYQIDFEFGKIYKDFFFKPVFLKITDLVNLNVFYSNAFLVTDSRSHLTTRLEYTAKERLSDVGYDLKPAYQTVRFRGLYYQDKPNKKKSSEYVDTVGGIVNFRQTITYLKKYIFTKFDIAISDRIDEIFRHPIVYVDRERSTISDFKSDPIQGDTNFKTGELILNPKRQYFSVGNQLFIDYDLIAISPTGIYVAAGFPSNIQLSFNKATVIGTGTLKIFNASNVLIATFTESDISVSGSNFVINNSSFVTNIGKYYFIISEGLFNSAGGEKFKVEDRTRLTFEISDGFYDLTYYDSTYYL